MDYSTQFVSSQYKSETVAADIRNIKYSKRAPILKGCGNVITIKNSFSKS